MSDFDAKAATWDKEPKIVRARRVADGIARRVPLAPGMEVFEYGAGTGLLGLALLDRVGHVTLADSSKGMLEVAQGKIDAGGLRASTLLLDLSRDAPPPARFDLACSLLTLHHVPDTDALLRALRAMLRTPGWIALADLDTEDGSFHGPGVEVHHGFDRADLGARLVRAGFRSPSFETACVFTKGDGDAARDYPVFLAVAST